MRTAHRSRRKTAIAALAIAMAATTALTACGDSGSGSGTALNHKEKGLIAFLIVRSNAIRYLAHDQPEFTQKVLDLCPGCTVDIRYAEQDAKVQETQVKEELDKGAKVIVLNAVAPASAAPMVDMAHQRGVPVISHDRLIFGAPIDYYVSFDNRKNGVLQGKALADAVDARGGGEVLWIDGPASDVNAKAFSEGAMEGSGGRLKIAARWQIPGPGWIGDQVKAWLLKTIPTMKDRKIAGIYCPTDTMAGFVFAALKELGITAPPAVTGQDSDMAAIQRVMAGQQLMTIYKPFHMEVEKTAELAYELMLGRRPKAETTVDNKAGQIPAFLISSTLVTKDNIKDTVVKDKFVTTTALCSGQFSTVCKSAGIV